MKILHLRLPEAGFPKRMRMYLAEMFPVPNRFFSSLLMYGSFSILLGRIQEVSPFAGFLTSVIGILGIFCILLSLRLMDELKDRDIDLTLFPGRPLPSGRIFESDIRLALWAVVTLYLLLNSFRIDVFWVAVAVLLYSLLMYEFFFVPNILRRSLILTLITHNPVIPLIMLYVLAIFVYGHFMEWKDVRWPMAVFLILQYWWMFFAWEISRKIRCREDENEYVTYSRILGRTGSVLVAGGAQTGSFVLGIYFWSALSLSTVYIAPLTAGYILVAWGHVRFLLNPNPKTSKLKHFAEGFAISVLIAGILEEVVHTLSKG